MSDDLGYEQYKLEWMLEHGYTLKHLIKELQMCIDEQLDVAQKDDRGVLCIYLEGIFKEWELERGFSNAEIWAYEIEYDALDKNELLGEKEGKSND